MPKDMPEHWMQTLQGNVFQAYNPQPDQIDLEDIAHALSMLCRFNGHVEKFYSVAQHSVLCSYIVPEGFELEALMHDATEAYIGDMPSPVKRGQKSFQDLEDRIYAAAIAHKFHLPQELSKEVKLADLQMLVLEKQYLVRDYGYDWGDVIEKAEIPLRVSRIIPTIDPLSPSLAKKWFLARFEQLTKEVAA